MPAWRYLFLCCGSQPCLSGARGVTVEQLLSREINGLDPYRAYMTVGRDANVYLACGGQQPCILRLSADGAARPACRRGRACAA